MGRCTPCALPSSARSTTNVELTTWLVAAMYNSIGSFSRGVTNTRDVDKRCLRLSKAACASAVQVNLYVFLSNW
jgi:hypothetical protein